MIPTTWFLGRRFSLYCRIQILRPYYYVLHFLVVVCIVPSLTGTVSQCFQSISKEALLPSLSFVRSPAAEGADFSLLTRCSSVLDLAYLFYLRFTEDYWKLFRYLCRILWKSETGAVLLGLHLQIPEVKQKSHIECFIVKPSGRWMYLIQHRNSLHWIAYVTKGRGVLWVNFGEEQENQNADRMTRREGRVTKVCVTSMTSEEPTVSLFGLAGLIEPL